MQKAVTVVCLLALVAMPLTAQSPDLAEPLTKEQLEELRAETLQRLDNLPDLDPFKSRLALMRMLDTATDEELPLICYGAEKERLLSDERVNLAVRLSALLKGKDVPDLVRAESSAELSYRDPMDARLRLYELLESADDRHLAALYRGASGEIAAGRERDRLLRSLGKLKEETRFPEAATSLQAATSFESGATEGAGAAMDHPCVVAWQICKFDVPDVCPPGNPSPTCDEIHDLCETIGDYCGWEY